MPTPRPIDPAAPFFVVINEGAGKHGPGSASEVICGVLTEAAREHHLQVVEDAASLPTAAAHAVAQARARNGVVVVAGGDGTINCVVRATLPSGCPLGAPKTILVTEGIGPDGKGGFEMELKDAATLMAEAESPQRHTDASPVHFGLAGNRGERAARHAPAAEQSLEKARPRGE